MEVYAETLKVNLEAITVRYNEIYAENVKLQVQYSETVGKYQVLEAQYNNLRVNYDSMLTGLSQKEWSDEDMAEQYQELFDKYQEEVGKAGKYDQLLGKVLMVSRRECPEINALTASEQTVFYKGWNLWGTKYIAEFYKPLNLVSGEFDSLWGAIELVSDHQCYEVEQGLTSAELTSFFKAWDLWRDNYADSYEDSDDFDGLLDVVLRVSRRQVEEINALTASEQAAFYKGWGIWGNTYVQPIIP